MDETTSARSEFEAAVLAATRDLRPPTATRGLAERRAEIRAAAWRLLAAERERIRLLVAYHVATLKDKITEETP